MMLTTPRRRLRGILLPLAVAAVLVATLSVSTPVHGATDSDREATINRDAVPVPTPVPTSQFCDRTPAVQFVIMRKIPALNKPPYRFDCTAVTAAQLAAVTGTLDLQRSGISALRAGDFDGLSRLGTLSLQHNSLASLPAGIFDDLTGLKRLRLNGNQLSALPAGIFSTLGGLQHLHLGNNRLTGVPDGLLAGNSGLLMVSLHQNKLTSLPAGLFDGLTRLRTLRLHQNELTSLPAGLFADLTAIETLRLDDAVNPRLCDEPPEEQSAVLDRLPRIDDCRLVTDGDIRSARAAVPTSQFCDRTPVVQFVIMRKIASLGRPPYRFDCTTVTAAQLAAVTGTLDLERIGISELRAGDFDGLSRLGTLSLQHNSLTSLPAGIFDDLTSLSRLRLNGNQLSALPAGVFATLGGLEHLHVGNNRLTGVPDDLLDANPRLLLVALHNNRLSSLPAGLFDGLTHLKTLRLHQNELTSLPAGLFADLAAIETLRLDDAVNPRLCDKPPEEQSSVLDHLPDISDCRLVTDGDIALAKTSAARSICERTPAVRDAIVAETATDCADVTSEQLAAITGTLDLKRSGISALRAGDFDGLSGLTTLHLQDNELSSLPAGLFEDLSSLRDLRLDSNRLLSLDADVLVGKDNLNSVSLGSNHLTTVPPMLFSNQRNLQVISLHDNDLIALPDGIFDGLGKLQTLHLTQNPLSTLQAGLFRDTTGLQHLRLPDALDPRVCDRPIAEQIALLSGPFSNVQSCRQITDGDFAAARPAAGICSRTPAVRNAIVAKVSGVRDCAAVTDAHLAAVAGDMHLNHRQLTVLQSGDFSGLSGLAGLGLRSNGLTTLPDGVFDDLTSLSWLHIDNNKLTSLPTGIFSELSSLRVLHFNNNQLTTAAPGLFDGLDTLRELHMHANAFTTLPAGLFADLTSIVTLLRDAAVNPSVCNHKKDIRDSILDLLPDISNCLLVTDGDIAAARNALPMLPLCDRTPAVRDAILALIPDVSECSEVTAAQLAAVTGTVDLGNSSISSLKAGDFDGLAGLVGLSLQHNDLASLPSGLFDGLTALVSLRLNDNQITELPAGILSTLTGLKHLYLGTNQLATVPAGLLDGNRALLTVSLSDNKLAWLPAGLFDELTRLQTLHLNKNKLTAVPVRLLADLSAIETLSLDDAINARLCDEPLAERTKVLDSLEGLDDCRLVTASDIDSLTHPNIIVIMADDLGYGDLGSYGQTMIATPRLDAMAAAGMRFTDFYSGHPLCPPAREALLTGRHTGNTALRGHKPGFDSSFCSARTTLGQMLQSAGYRTAVIGKWGVGGEGTAAHPNDQGFDHFFGFLEHAHAHNSYPDMLFRNREQVPLSNILKRQRSFSTGGLTEAKGRFEYSQDLFMEEALEFITQANDAGQPFFLYLPVTLPHANTSGLGDQSGIMEPPPSGHGQYADESWIDPEKAYAAVVSYLDNDVGRLLDSLDELGIASETVTFFTSDNGPANEGKHSRQHFDSAGELSGGKRTLREGGIRVPLIVHWPENIAAGGVSSHISAAWDLMPTLAQIADIPAPPGTDGISMVPTLLGDEGQAEHEYLYWNFQWASTTGTVDERAVRSGKWKAWWANWRSIRLFNLETDIGETTDVAAANPDVVKRMQAFITEAHTARWDVISGVCLPDRLAGTG